LEDLREAFVIFEFSMVKRAKVAVKELKPVICHELNDRVLRALIL
jgi:hypothetical protein